MPRVNLGVYLLGIVLLSLLQPYFVVAQQELFKPMIDVSRSLQAWVEDVEEGGELTELPKSAFEGDLYEKAYNNVQYQTAKPVLDALQEVHASVANRCDNKLSYQDISNVFAETKHGQTYFTLMNRRKIVDKIDNGDFSRSCEAVYKCYYASLDPEDAGYSQMMVDSCKSIVSESFSTMWLRTSTLETIRNSNYGDEFFSNAKAEDAPYDILLDIEAIGDILFSHNDPASEIHLYEMTERIEYVDNDPAEVTPYDVEQPNRDDEKSANRLPPANSTSPLSPSPDEVVADPYPSDGPAKGIGILDDTSPGGSPDGSQGGSLQNPICIAPDPYEVASEDEILLEYAQIEYQQTKEYNDQLDLYNNVAVALLGKIAPELEEQYGTDEIIVRESPEIVAKVTEIIDDIDLKAAGDAVEELRSKFRSCVENMVEGGDGNVFQKQIWKTITQPTRLTECVMQASCQELTDKTGRGLYRFRICKVPTKKYDVTTYQPVYSIEEVIDEIANVCTNLKESGQLIEHNKTKDHFDHKLMRVNFADKVSFGVSIGIVPLWNEVDISAIKRIEIQRNAYLEDVILDISDELTTISERNKYIVLADPVSELISNMPGDPEALELRSREYQQVTVGTTDTSKHQQSQLSHYGEMLDLVAQFVKDNSSFWQVANDYTESLNQKWQATYQEFKNDSGQ